MYEKLKNVCLPLTIHIYDTALFAITCPVPSQHSVGFFPEFLPNGCWPLSVASGVRPSLFYSAILFCNYDMYNIEASSLLFLSGILNQSSLGQLLAPCREIHLITGACENGESGTPIKANHPQQARKYQTQKQVFKTILN